MRYLLLIHRNEDSAAAVSDQEMEENIARAWSVIDEMTKQGVFRGADPLEPSTTAATVRVRDGKALTTDGPFAETKEQLAGYFIVDCKNIGEAIAWAGQLPICGTGEGCVEVRAIRELPARPGTLRFSWTTFSKCGS